MFPALVIGIFVAGSAVPGWIDPVTSKNIPSAAIKSGTSTFFRTIS
jgi:hypothetical protein